MLTLKHMLHYPKQGVFLVDEKYLFVLTSLRDFTSLHEIGGKDKSFKQIKYLKHSFVAADDLETGFGCLGFYIKSSG